MNTASRHVLMSAIFRFKRDGHEHRKTHRR